MSSTLFVLLVTAITILFVVYFIYWFWALITSAPYYPSNRKAIKTILEELQNYQIQNIIELGSGDGRIAVALAKAGYKVTAVEMNPLLTVITHIKKLIWRLDELEIKQSDLFKEEFSQYDAVVMYLYPHLMAKLDPVLFSQMKKDSIIISNTFQFKNRKPIKQLDNKIYVYRTGNTKE